MSDTPACFFLKPSFQSAYVVQQRQPLAELCSSSNHTHLDNLLCAASGPSRQAGARSRLLASFLGWRLVTSRLARSSVSFPLRIAISRTIMQHLYLYKLN